MTEKKKFFVLLFLFLCSLALLWLLNSRLGSTLIG